MSVNSSSLVFIKKRKNRQTKTHLVFNEEERKQYLNGFKKRKDARRKKAREEMERRLKEEKRLLKQERRDMLKRILHTDTSLPDVERIVKPTTYELPNHTVTITSINDVDFLGTHDLLLGQNKEECDDDENMKNNSDVQKDEVAYDDNLGFKALQRRLQQRHNEVMQSSKAMRQKQTIKRTKDRQQARRKKKIYNKTLKQRGKRCRSNDN